MYAEIKKSRAFITLLALLLLICSGLAQTGTESAGYLLSPKRGIHFADVTESAGIHFVHNSGAFGKKYLPETLGPGVAFIDYNNDGWPDIFFVNGKDWPGHPVHGDTSPALYRNNHDGTFTDVTKQAGLALPIYGLGVAVGDYDNDGYDDLFVTSYGQNHLFHNNGKGKFTDVTKSAGLWGPNEFSTSAAWVDYDRDGLLDLVAANYVSWSPQSDLFCTLDGKTKSYCTPESYNGTSVRLWHNNGNGTFTDLTRKAGLYDPTAKGLGIAILDVNQDGWPDIAISNDTQPNKLYINNRNGTFSEKGVASGIGFSEDGMARAGMGIDASDYDRSGSPSIAITNFSDQMMALYHNEGNGQFQDVALQSAIGRDSIDTLGFGCFFFDFDNDGWPDLYVADGHIDSTIDSLQRRVRYAEPPHLFHNLGNGRFEEVTAEMGQSFSSQRIGRGAAFGDVNNDGVLDIVVTTNGGRAYLYEGEGVTNSSLRLKLVGTKSNRDGIGAVIVVRAENGTQWQMTHSGSSYLSQSELVATFGLGQSKKADSVEIHWPSGLTQGFRDLPAGETLTVVEGKRIMSAIAYSAIPKSTRQETTKASSQKKPLCLQ